MLMILNRWEGIGLFLGKCGHLKPCSYTSGMYDMTRIVLFLNIVRIIPHSSGFIHLCICMKLALTRVTW